MLAWDPALKASLSSIKMAGRFFYLGKSRNKLENVCFTVTSLLKVRKYDLLLNMKL